MGKSGWLVVAACAALCACDTKPIGARPGSPAGGQSAPSKELNTVSHMGENKAPIVDPTGAVHIGKGLKHQIGCENNLDQIGKILMLYTSSGHDFPPQGLFFRTLIEASAIQDINLCAVPRSNPSREEVFAQQGEKAYRVTMDRINDSTNPSKPIVWDPVPFEDGRHVLLASGSVVFRTEDQFQAMIAEWEGKK